MRCKSIINMTQKEKTRIKNILDTLDEMYPDERCYLEYKTDWQLLFATILSAQCTDARVNMITKDLYKMRILLSWRMM